MTDPQWTQGSPPAEASGSMSAPASHEADQVASVMPPYGGGIVPLGAQQRMPWAGYQDTQSAMIPSTVGVQSPAVPSSADADPSYSHWERTHNMASGVEQKLSALSRRTAAELRRAEKERGEHTRRLEALEELCRQHLGDLDERLQQARDDAAAEVERVSQRSRARIERDLQSMSEALEHHCSESLTQESDTYKALTKRADADHELLEDLRAWRREAEQRLLPASNGDSSPGKKTLMVASRNDISDSIEEHVEATLARERKQAHERLRSSCAELTANMNELRRELVEQRHMLEQSTQGLEARRERLRIDLETQIAELGGALASRLQAKISSTSKAVEEQVNEVGRNLSSQLSSRLVALEDRSTTLEGSDEWLGSQLQQWRREHQELTNGVQNIQELVRRETEQVLEAAREESRTVHLEVMSIDTRVAGLEERLSDDPGRRRYDALLRVNGERLPAKQLKPGD